MMRSLAIWALVLSGCTAAVDPSGGPSGTATGSTGEGPVGPGSTQTTAGPSAGTTAAEASTSSTGATPPETEGADEGYGTTGSCGFTCPPPPGPNGSSCDFSEQDCGRGLKCAPWANDGGSLWNALRCVPVAPDARSPGEPCAAEGSFASGVDDCEPGAVCTAANDDSLQTNEGVCAALCNAGPCPSGTLCTVPTALDVGVCGAICDPLADDACSTGQACLPAGFGFACHTALSEPVDAPCGDTVSACGPGHLCVDAAQCEDRCCAQVCDLAAPDCPAGQSCTSYGSPLSAYATVGFCEG